MIDLQNIKKYYPNSLQSLERFMLREYLQYKILESIQDSDESSKLVFIGGTALRITHNSQRFSEDLDFDNYNLTPAEFSKLCNKVSKDFKLIGVETEQKIVTKESFRLYLKFPKILHQLKISDHKQEKFLVQIDTMTKGVKYNVDTPTINKFDVTTKVRTAPIDILLSKKVEAIFGRKRPKGRDYFDFAWAITLTEPNYEYLSKTINVNSKDELKKGLLSFTKNLNFQKLATDVEPFLFDNKSRSKVILFREIIKNW